MIKYLEDEKIYRLWLKFQTVAICCIFVYFSLFQFAPNYLGALYSVPYRLCGLLLIIGFLLIRRFKDGLEFKLFFFYLVWITVMRIIDGSFFLDGVPDGIFNRWMSLPLCVFALVIPAEKRLKLMDIMAIIYAVAYTLLAFICIYAGPEQLTLINPLTGTELCEFVGGRLHVFWKNSNAVSTWFMLACWMLLYLFFRSKKPVWKIIIVPAILANYVALALTFSRSAQLGFVLGAGMFAAALALKKLPLEKLWHKAAVFLLCMCICLPVYKGFALSTTFINSLAPESSQSEVVVKTRSAANAGKIETLSMVQLDSTAKAPQSEKEKQEDMTDRLNNRGLHSTGRTELWYGAIKTIEDEPSRLITGKFESIVDTNDYIRKYDRQQFVLYGDRIHHHNAYLEMFLYSGIPGFALIMGFLLLLVYKMVKLYFCKKSDMALISLIVMLTGLFIYNLFESCLLHIYDMRNVTFFILAGYMLAFEKELCRKY